MDAEKYDVVVLGGGNAGMGHCHVAREVAVPLVAR